MIEIKEQRSHSYALKRSFGRPGLIRRQTDVSRRLNAHKESISQWKLGRNRVPFSKLFFLANALDEFSPPSNRYPTGAGQAFLKDVLGVNLGPAITEPADLADALREFHKNIGLRPYSFSGSLKNVAPNTYGNWVAGASCPGSLRDFMEVIRVADIVANGEGQKILTAVSGREVLSHG